MLVRDIVERPASAPKAPGEAPAPPRPPVASKAGFPIAAHRSKGSSAFARARKDDATRRAGGLTHGQGRVVESVPTVAPVASTSGVAPATEEEKIRQQVEEENRRRVAEMSPAEREQEAEELKERFGPDIVNIMKKRRDARTSTQTASAGADPSSPTARPPSTAITEDEKILESADKANRAKVAGMSLEEHAKEMDELEELFGAPLLAKLRARAKAKADGRPAPAFEPEPKPEPEAMDVDVKSSASPAPPAAEAQAPTPALKTGEKPKRSVRFSEEDAPTPAALQRYFPGAEPEKGKLQWMEDTPMKSADEDTGPRFDLAGAPLSAEAAAQLPTHLGLHHHGASPDLAGYTLSEITHLCYSTVASQRITMIGVLTKLVRRYRAALSSGSADAWVKFCTEEDVLSKGVDVAVGVLSAHARSVGVFASAVELLYTTLGGPWGWMDESGEIVAFRPEPARDGEPTGVASVPWDDVVPQLSVTLGLEPGAIPEGTLAQLVQILRRAALAQPAGAEAITALLPPLLRAHVLSAPWPPDPARPPSALALDLLRDVTVSSRASAEALLAQNAYAPLLKFATSADFADPAAHNLLVRVMRLFYQLGRYGLAAGTATAARDVWLPVSRWAADHPDTEVARAYFDLVSVWTTCAIDPHRTTPEHDLTWAQAAAPGWLDEILAAAASLQTQDDWASLASVLGALAEWVAGSEVNEPKHGGDVKAHVLAALQDMQLVEHLPQSVADMPQFEGRDAFNGALTQVFRLHSLLKPAGALISSPEKERLIFWLAATTQACASDVYLRHALLQVAREDGVLAPAEWASSAFDLALSYAPGDEPLALALVDDLLRADWSSAGPGAAAVAAIGHRDGLQVLRPLVHHAILPSLTDVQGPRRPDYHYLKASTTLRPPPPTSGPGLPLAPDWVFAPLNELLASGSSEAFALAPKDWDAGETQLTRATLALALLDEEARGVRHPSALLLNAMKVFMLEHGQADAPNTEHDVFRDDAVNAALSRLLDSVSATGSHSDTHPDSHEGSPEPAGQQQKGAKEGGRSAPLEKAALPFLGPGVPFFQFYTDLLALYESSSFGDAAFGRVLLPPLSRLYDADYRRLFWAEAPDALRSVRTKVADVPSETGNLEAFFEPRETEKDVLSGYARALVTTLRDRGADEFLPMVASHHVASLFWTTTDEERTGLRVQLMVVMLSSATDAVLKRIVQWDLQRPLGGQPIGDAEIQERVADMGRITGPRGQARLKAAGYL